MIISLLSSIIIGATNALLFTPVNIFGFDFVSDTTVLSDHPIEWIETGQWYRLNSSGQLTINALVGSSITLHLPKYKDYHSMQTATVTVPPTGLNTYLTEIILQVPSIWIYDLIWLIVAGHNRRRIFSTECNIVVTICAPNKTWMDKPQGLPNTKAYINHNNDYTIKIFYFGTYGKWSNSTNPFPNNLNSTSWDGGVLFENVPLRSDYYTITANYSGGGFDFSLTKIKCFRPNTFINAAPNQGPRAVKI